MQHNTEAKEVAMKIIKIVAVLIVILCFLVGCVVEPPDTPDVPPDVPDVPDVPDIPDIPDVPDVPDEPQPITVDTPLSGGFIIKMYGELIPPGLCAFSSSTSISPREDVTITILYGTHFSPNMRYETENGGGWGNSRLYFRNVSREPDKLLHIKTNDDIFTSEKYRVTSQYDFDAHIETRSFNHSESITIPAELFTGAHGIIEFSFDAQLLADPDLTYQFMGRIFIYYKVHGNYVALAAEEIGDRPIIWPE
jgi:hypothetical protein